MKSCWSLNKHNSLLVKLAISVLLMGLAFRLFFFNSGVLSPPDLEATKSDSVDETEVKAAEEGNANAKPPDAFTVDVSEYEDQTQTPQKVDDAGVDDQNGMPQKVDDARVDDDQNEMPQKVDAGGPDEDHNEMPQKVDAGGPDEDQNGMPQKDFGEEKCDLFTGDWIPDLSGPVYTNASCPLIEGHQNCMRNGRPDSGYLNWRWKPQNCDMPQFDAERFLNMMRNKTFALIGDSISRNHVQSLLCMLSTVEPAVDVYHDEGYKSKGWEFPSYNFSVSVIWSPFLVKAEIFEDNNGVSTSEVELRLDKLDEKWTEQYFNWDYIIISTGKWFLKSSIYYENDTVLGCHYCPKRNLTELGFDFAYNKTLQRVMDFIATSKHKGLIFFRTSTPDHFENGEWHNGGNCLRTMPVKQGEVELKDLNKILLNIELPEFEKAAAKAAENGVKLKLLDFTNLLLLRPDGHPGPYREFQPFAKDKNATVQNDCLHWCLPGPLDAWNDLIMEMIVNAQGN